MTGTAPLVMKYTKEEVQRIKEAHEARRAAEPLDLMRRVHTFLASLLFLFHASFYQRRMLWCTLVCYLRETKTCCSGEGNTTGVCKRSRKRQGSRNHQAEGCCRSCSKATRVERKYQSPQSTRLIFLTVD